MRRLAVLLVLASVVPACTPARPRHWYKDWRVWAGEAMIVGSLVADGRSTCLGFSRGLVEGNAIGRGGRSCGQAVSILAVGGGIYTGLHIWENKLNEGETSKPWRAAGYLSIPVIVCSFHCTAAALNYEKLPPR